MTRTADRVEAWVFRRLVGLPAPVVRRLAGRPVVLDGQVLDPETQWILRLQKLARDPGFSGPDVQSIRAATRRSTRLAGGRQPIGAVRDPQVPGAEGALAARLYTPASRLVEPGPRVVEPGPGVVEPVETPLLVFLHGGGMVFGDLDTHDATCRMLAERADTLVLAVDYRLAPEHPFPAAVDDCWAAFRWAAEHAAELGADPGRVAIGGDSAGGALSAICAIRAAEAGIAVKTQLLLYPVTDLGRQTESRRLFGEGFLLTADFMELASTSYVTGEHDLLDPAVSVLHHEKLPADLAPALVATAGFDPLRDEGEAYARAMSEAGVPVRLTRYPGMIHGFANVVGVGRSNRAAVAEIAARLKAALHD